MKRDFSRQSFLGDDSEAILAAQKIAIIGLGGGGGHIVQQTAHLGVGIALGVDDDKCEASNLNRLIGATFADIEQATPKAIIAERLYKGINPGASFRPFLAKWQAVQPELVDCSVIFGAVDSFSERDQLERFARRFMIPYIDIGMDVHETEDGFKITGQVIFSAPGGPCMRCMNFITDAELAKEAGKYGAAGAKPQVVWPNGVLASTAVGLFVQLVTPWHGNHRTAEYLVYDGNTGEIHESHRLKFALVKPCPHYRDDEVGDPFFRS